mmetsp:Transcript_17279/g.70158  ORF Transcript_17279/g.70158 Transcript_17279/m.70158 type:complete len:152 (+) Transcript_17279:669-1124(+)
MVWWTTSQRLAIDDRMVVSEIGVQWSPKTAPERIAEIVKMKISESRAAYQEVGTMIGNSMLIVPQLVPVQKLITAATMNVNAGRALGSKLPESALAKKMSAPLSDIASPMAQAKINTSTGAKMPLIPSMNAVKFWFMVIKGRPGHDLQRTQ